MRQGPKFHKSKEVIWLTVINEIFKFPPRLDTFGYVNYLHELSSNYQNDPAQNMMHLA